MIMKQRDGKLEQLLEKYKILDIVNERKKDLEREIESLENALEDNERKDSFTYLQKNRQQIGQDFRNDRVGQDFRNDYIGMDYRTGYKFYSSNQTYEGVDPIIY